MSDTAAKPRMQRIPFATESAETDSPPGSMEQLINFFVEALPTQARSSMVLRSTPGLDVGQFVGTGPVWEMNADLPGQILVASGQKFFRVNGDGSLTTFGDVGSFNQSFYANGVTIAAGPTQAIVVVPPRAFGVNTGGTTMTQLTGTADNPFPGASSVAYLDGYFVFTAAENSSRFFSTPLLDNSTFNALDFAYADAVPNVVRRVISHQGRLWFMGESAVEVWVDQGDVNFPFIRDSGGIIPYGVRSPKSVAVCDGSIFWLSDEGVVLRTNGYAAVRVSTHAIEQQIHSFTSENGSLARGAVQGAFSYSQNGHTFYVLTLQTASSDPGRTFVYDCATKLWHERSTTVAGAPARWRANCAISAGVPILGDFTSGSLMALNESGTYDIDVLVLRTAISPPLGNTSQRVFMDRLEVECELGGAFPLMLNWTDDGGATWKGARSMTLNGKRAFTTRLGSFRERSLRLQTQGRVRVYSVDAQIESGTS